MSYFLVIFIFALVLFLYLHVHYHLKTSSDLEVYTIERPSKDKLEEICDLRQPVLFDFHSEDIQKLCGLERLDDNYGAFDIKIRDISKQDENAELHLPFLLKEGLKLFQEDTTGRFITEKNREFLDETGVIKALRYNDSFLRPPMVARCIYDIWSGSVGAQTPLRYSLSYRNFLYVTTGKVRIKLIPPSATRYLSLIKDYDNSEYRSPINPWEVSPEHKASFDKVKVLDVELSPGLMMSIPAYWWFSLEYTTLSSICVFQYRTYMSALSILPETVMALLQGQSIKREIAEKMDDGVKPSPPKQPEEGEE